MKAIRGLLKIIFGRTTITILGFILQIILIWASLFWFQQYGVWIFGGFVILAVILTIHILNSKQNPAFKMAWIITILLFPAFGCLLYLFVKFQFIPKQINKKLQVLEQKNRNYLQQNEAVFKAIANPQVSNLVYYMNDCGKYPIYRNTNGEYYSNGEKMFAALKEALKEAKQFIFLEYFIIDDGIMWETILEILKEKVKEGIEVRVMYDGMCSLFQLPKNYYKKLREYGIQCKLFAPIKPIISTHYNNRDHRKIAVIDGKIAFTGGINLADEYINAYERFGHWKDTAISLKGEAVTTFTMLFLDMWNIDVPKAEQYAPYLTHYSVRNNGFVMPYGDSPLDEEYVGASVYLDIINTATKYISIMTPYLILDNEMVTALKFAAKRGVKTTIIMPHIPDKKYAYLLARTYYPELIEAGVSIYEYTPGFIHSKVFVSDDEKAVVGTINLDYRSLYLHFECATYLYKHNCIAKITEDFDNTLKKCQQITLQNCKNYPWYKKLSGRLLRMIAPLM